jgi:hypothetical protein
MSLTRVSTPILLQERDTSCKRSRFPFLLILLFLFSVLPAAAQESDRSVGFGGIVGRNNGISLKMYLEGESLFGNVSGKKSFDVSMSWNFDDFFYWSGHLQTERAIPDSPLNFFIGPGFTFGLDKKELFWGPSVNLGVFFNRERFEIFLQLTPRIFLIPDTVGELGSAVGLRYFI